MSSVNLAIFGLGLVTPIGASARDHAFFPRADAVPPRRSPFVLDDDAALDVRYCAFVDRLDGTARRLAPLAARALDEAIAPLVALAEAARAGEALALYVCTPRPAPDLTAEAIADLARGLGDRARAALVVTCPGAAGAFSALEQAAQAIAQRQATCAAIVGVDSLVRLGWLRERVLRPPNPWALTPPPPSEGAGALLVAPPAAAKRLGTSPRATVHEVRVARGTATDDDDEIVDGHPTSSMLASLPAGPPIQAVFGQTRVDEMRLREWEFTVARNAARFDPVHHGDSLESRTGAIGAAAGAASIAYAVAAIGHGTTPLSTRAPAPTVAWAISSDGTRGLALLGVPLGSGLVALGNEVQTRRVERAPFEPPPAEASDEAPLLPDPAYQASDEEIADFEAEDSPEIGEALPALPEISSAAPPVRLDPARVRVITVPELHREVTRSACDVVTQLLRDRIEVPWRAVPEVEERICVQIDAVVAAGPRALSEVAAWWAERVADPGRAAAGTLACLAFEGTDAADAVRHVLGLVPDEAGSAGAAAAQALGLSAHEGLAVLLRDLAASAGAAARAAGVAGLGARASLLPAERRQHLADPDPSVVRAAIGAIEPLGPDFHAGFLHALRDRSLGPDPSVAFAAARVLLLWADDETIEELRSGALAAAAGPRGLELHALAGEPADRAVVVAALGRHPPTPMAVAALGRYGHAALAPHILQLLSVPELAEPAAAALETMLGAAVAAEARLDAKAWADRVESARLDPAVLWRRGEPRSAPVIAGECASGTLSRIEIGRRLDELRVLRGPGDPVSIDGWFAAADAALKKALG